MITASDSAQLSEEALTCTAACFLRFLAAAASAFAAARAVAAATSPPVFPPPTDDPSPNVVARLSFATARADSLSARASIEPCAGCVDSS